MNWKKICYNLSENDIKLLNALIENNGKCKNTNVCHKCFLYINNISCMRYETAFKHAKILLDYNRIFKIKKVMA